MAAMLLEYNVLLDLNIDNVTVLALILGLGLLSASLVTAGLFSKWHAWAGVGIGMFGLTAYIVGVAAFSPYALLNPILGPYIVAALVWTLILGVMLYRGKFGTEPGAAATD